MAVMPERRGVRRVARMPIGRVPSELLAATTTVGFLLAATPASADNLFVAPSLLWRETYTDNATFGISQQAQNDVISELIPSLVLFGLTKNLQVSVNMQVDAIDYLHGTEPSGLLPTGGVEATFQGLDQHFFLDASALATQGRENVYAATPAGPSTYNVFTTEAYRASPYVKGELPGNVLYLIRSDNFLQRAFGTYAAVVDSRLTMQSIDLDHIPRPLGWSVHGEASQTNYTSSTTPIIRQELAVGIVKVAPDPQLVISGRGGIEQEDYLVDTQPSSVYGGGLEWRPDDRTSLEGLGQHRFYGTQWDYGFKHREHFLAVTFSGGRDVVTSAQTVFALPVGGDMAALLDSILLPDHPDPVERAGAVQALLAQQNLPNTLAAGSTIYAPAPVLLTSNKGALTWIATRDTISLSGYQMRTQLVPAAINPQYIVVSEADQNNQFGADL
ncbi:MAG TPA: TIGR03016 family PEP-CTERM system-associated outer membrane protein, partial [Burkholderiaceae bacterium]|nr:TIGR03016 family PEP-CTERM system-associated outer membrane protein [Burkholderiaceae bacterium]